jgi:hypothetical protein
LGATVSAWDNFISRATLCRCIRPSIYEKFGFFRGDYLEKPKKDGSQKKEVGFRWHDTKFFTDDDLSRKNNWSPIINALEGSQLINKTEE